jgi:drug/metabolite transporter (DMT)-like permease
VNVLGFAAAVAGAVCFGTGLALQKRRAVASAQLGLASARAWWALVSDRGWLLATGVVLLGWALALTELRSLPAAVVFPCNVLSVAVLCLLAARWFHERLHLREWAGLAACVAGAVLGGLSTAAPGTAPSTSWHPGVLAAAVLGLAGASAGLLLAVRLLHRAGEIPTALAAGLLYAGTGLLTKAVAAPHAGATLGLIAGLLAALVGVSVCAVLLLQVAFQRGRAAIVVVCVSGLADFLPPLLSTWVFDEPWPVGVHGALRVAGIASLALGLALLAREAGRIETLERA